MVVLIPAPHAGNTTQVTYRNLMSALNAQGFESGLGGPAIPLHILPSEANCNVWS